MVNIRVVLCVLPTLTIKTLHFIRVLGLLVSNGSEN
jgi:hypothetical protein